MVGIRTVASLALAALASALFAAPARAEDDEALKEKVEAIVKEMKKDEDFRAYWKDTLRFETGDKKIKLKMGGRIMLDYSWYDGDDLKGSNTPDIDTGDWENGWEFRRVRWYTEGELYHHVAFKLQLDFAGASDEAEDSDVVFKDVYIELINLEDCFGCPFPDIAFGHFFQPFSLEQQTSSKYMTFMERSAIVQAFATDRKTGVKLSRNDLRGGSFGYGVSLYGPVEDDGGQGFWEDGMAAAARVWWAPWFDCNCACNRAHIGVAAIKEWGLDGRRFRARGPTHLTDRFVNTDTIDDVEENTIIGLEAAVVYGPWSVQAEYMMAMPESDFADDPTYFGWYVHASYWLTGECRNYKEGVFSRVKPCCNFLDNDCCCTGGWELKARYEVLDLTDGGGTFDDDSDGDGSLMTSITVGVNWHLNPNTRFMFEYFLSTFDDIADGYNSTDGADGTDWDNQDLSGFQMRVQVDF